MSFSALLDTGSRPAAPRLPPAPGAGPESRAPIAPGRPLAPAETIGEPVPDVRSRAGPVAPRAPTAGRGHFVVPAAAPAGAHRRAFRRGRSAVGRLGAVGVERGARRAAISFASLPSMQQLVAAVVVVVLVLGIGSAVLVSRRCRQQVPVHVGRAHRTDRDRGLDAARADVRTSRRGALPRARGLREDPGDRSERSSTTTRWQQIDQAAAEMRALGLIGGDVDVLDAYDQTQTSGTLAYYDPTKKEIYVRGETLDVAHRVTLAHELTHVLQDQHFDLQHLREQADATPNADPDALDAIVEGDAVRIQDDYLAQLSDTEKQQYDQQNGAELDRYDQASGSVPEIFNLQMGAPYLFGPYTIRVRLADDGNAAVDRALNGRPLSTRDVHRARATSIPAALVNPNPIPAGAEAMGEFSRFDAFDRSSCSARAWMPTQRCAPRTLVAGGRFADLSPDRRQGVRAGDARDTGGARTTAGFMSGLNVVGGGNAGRHGRGRRRLHRVHVV